MYTTPGYKTLLLIVACTALIAAACSSGAAPAANAVPTLTPTPLPTATPAPTATPTPKLTPTPTPEPPDLLFRYTYAMRLVRSGLYEDAIPQLDIVIRAMPELAQAYFGRGVAFINEEQEDLGLEDLNKAIELKPDYAEAYMHRGVLLVNRGKVQDGLEDLREALELYVEAQDEEGAAEVRKLLDSG